MEIGCVYFKSGTQSYDTYGSANTWTGNSSYSNARTPYILSQRIGGTAKNLFRVYTRNHGAEMNQQFRIEISQVKAAGSILGSDYGSFALQVKKYNPDQFEIIGLGISNSGLEFGVKPYKKEHKKYRKEVQKRGAVDGDLYMMDNGEVKVPYARIIIKAK